VFTKVKKFFSYRTQEGPDKKYYDYLRDAYPSNHTYALVRGKIKPTSKLTKRYQPLHRLFPDNLLSVADIGCAKGYFIFSASDYPHCQRAFGIDIHQEDIDVCQWVQAKLNNPRVSFQKMQLHELAEQIDQLGGPFQTVLLLNTYQYLYFGSAGHPECYLNHDTIFSFLRKICSQRVIFNNRMQWQDCQQQVKQLPGAESHRDLYSPEAILSAAARYFNVKEQGKIGRYPLLTLDVPG